MVDTQRETLETFFDILYGDDAGFAYLTDLAGYTESFQMPGKREEFIDAAYWNSDARLYHSCLLYTDGRIERTKDPVTGKTHVSTGRRKENAKTARVVFLDADDARPDQMRLEPSIINYSSPGRGHLYWALDKDYPASQVIEVVKMIAEAHHIQGADKSSANGAKLLLVPGSRNTKRDLATGELVHPDKPRVTSRFTGLVYTLDEIRKAYSDIQIRLTELEYELSDEVPPILEFQDLYQRFPEGFRTTQGHDLNGLIFDPIHERANRSDVRWLLLHELAREDLNAQEVLTIAWYSKPADKWKEDPRGIKGLWSEVQQAIQDVAQERGEGIEPPKREAYVPTGITLLDDEEREIAAASEPFVDQYCAWAKTRLTKANLPYHRGNAWTVASAAFGESAVFVENSSTRNLNLWFMIMGDTGTGKGEAKTLWLEMMEACSPEGFDGGSNIGANAHVNTLVETLIARDGKVSVLNTDEGDGILQMIQTQGWTTGTLQTWTDLFDGRVPVILRKNAKDFSGKAATSVFLVWFMGTEDGLTKVLSRDMFDSGFLTRFLWEIGEPGVVDEDLMRPVQGNLDTAVKRRDSFVTEWGERFEHYRRILGRYTRAVNWDEDSIRRIGDAIIDIHRTLDDKRHSKALKQAHRRIGMHMRKVATLNALCRGASEVTLADTLVAIRATEMWWKNLEHMVGTVSSSPYAKAKDEMTDWIREKGGTVLKNEFIYQFRDVDMKDRDTRLRDLVAEGWISEQKDAQKRDILVLKE